jgi:uncharacterized protein YejL (UPF0352 family)
MSFFLLSLFSLISMVFGFSNSNLLVPEVKPERRSEIANLVSEVLDDENKYLRYESARSAALELQSTKETHELVYGELSVPVLATILDAVGVQQNERFLDIGSGDGALVLAASLLYADKNGNAVQAARGLEIIPGLYEHSLEHAKALKSKLGSASQDGDTNSLLNKHQAPVEFVLGDVHDATTDESLASILHDTTLAVCFATTWSAGNASPSTSGGSKTSLQSRRLDPLSKVLSLLPKGSRSVIVDGRLNKQDGHEWQGDLRVECPDTAPASIASLYCRI